MLTTEKLSLLASYLSRHTRAFHEVQLEFRQNFSMDEYASVTNLIARFLSTCPFENDMSSTEKIVAAQSPVEGTQNSEKANEFAALLRNPHFFSIEHAYAAVILNVTDCANIVSATELTKIEHILKERLVKKAVFGDDAADTDLMYQPYHYLKLLWLCGSKIPHGLLAFSGNEFFALPANRLEPYFAALRTDAMHRVRIVHPSYSVEPIFGIQLKENGFLSHATVMNVLAQVQEVAYPQYADYHIERLPQPKISSSAGALEYLIEGTMEPAGNRVREEFPGYSDYLICMQLIQKGTCETLSDAHTDFVLQSLFSSPENVNLFGITPQSAMALLHSNNIRLARTIFSFFAGTPLLPCFFSVFFDAANHSANVYTMLGEIAATGMLSEQYLIRILQAGFAAFGTECTCATEFTEANTQFCAFCIKLLRDGTLNASTVRGDICRYSTLHQCIPMAVELFVTLQNCTTRL